MLTKRDWLGEKPLFKTCFLAVELHGNLTFDKRVGGAGGILGYAGIVANHLVYAKEFDT